MLTMAWLTFCMFRPDMPVRSRSYLRLHTQFEHTPKIADGLCTTCAQRWLCPSVEQSYHLQAVSHLDRRRQAQGLMSGAAERMSLRTAKQLQEICLTLRVAGRGGGGVPTRGRRRGMLWQCRGC